MHRYDRNTLSAVYLHKNYNENHKTTTELTHAWADEHNTETAQEQLLEKDSNSSIAVDEMTSLKKS